MLERMEGNWEITPTDMPDGRWEKYSISLWPGDQVTMWPGDQMTRWRACWKVEVAPIGHCDRLTNKTKLLQWMLQYFIYQSPVQLEPGVWSEVKCYLLPGWALGIPSPTTELTSMPKVNIVQLIISIFYLRIVPIVIICNCILCMFQTQRWFSLAGLAPHKGTIWLDFH